MHIRIRGLQIPGSLVPDCKSGTAGTVGNEMNYTNFIV